MSFESTQRLRGEARVQGGRLHSTSGGSAGETRFLYDGDELIAEYDGAGTLLRRVACPGGGRGPRHAGR